MVSGDIRVSFNAGPLRLLINSRNLASDYRTSILSAYRYRLELCQSLDRYVGTLPTVNRNEGTPHPRFIYLCCVDTLLCFKNAPVDKTYCCQPSTDYSIYCSTGTYDGDVFLTLDTQYFQLNL